MNIARRTVVFDAADLESESTFWAELVGGEVIRDDDWHSIEVNGVSELAVQWDPDHLPPQGPTGGRSKSTWTWS